jgi:hypothetical protein
MVFKISRMWDFIEDHILFFYTRLTGKTSGFRYFGLIEEEKKRFVV